MFELGFWYIFLGLCVVYFKFWVFIVVVLYVIFVVLLYCFMKVELVGICDDLFEEKFVKENEVSLVENGDVKVGGMEMENGDVIVGENKMENKIDD